MSESSVGFWSYAHEDNELDSGRILELAADLRSEYALLTGEPLQLFVDRTEIEWGDTWRVRIDDALVSTTFMIPIITPRYFTREECVRELFAFHREALRKGVPDLLMPILYVAVDDFTSENPDEPIALVAQRQYVDWTELRLDDRGSMAYRRSVNQLAVVLRDTGRSVAERQLKWEREAIGADRKGVLDLADAVEGPLRDWLEIVHADELGVYTYDSTNKYFDERMKRAAPGGPRYALLRKRAETLLPESEAHVRYTQTLLAKTIELDPDVTSALHAIVEHPEHMALFPTLITALTEARRVLADNEARLKEPKSLAASVWARRYAHLTRTMGVVADLHEKAERNVDDSEAIAARWFRLMDQAEAARGA